MNTGRAILGTALVGLGSLFLLDQAGALDAADIISAWWPTLFLVAAALDLLTRPARPVSATVLALVGLGLLSVTTDLIDASVWAIIWPLAVILLGIWLLFRRTPVGAGIAHTGDPDMDVTVVFSGRKVVNTARPFRRGTATALFGGVEVDLTGAELEGEAVLDVVALFGGIDIEVPPGWRVLLDGPAIFGGHDSHVPEPSVPDAPTLRVQATAIFGGVDVKVGSVARVPA